MQTTLPYDPFRPRALVFIGDPHVADSGPGHRSDDYPGTCLRKLRFCLELAREREALPIILGDFFHYPRDNSSSLVVRLIELLRPYRPFCLVGNHDKYESRLTEDVSLSVLHAAGVVRLMSRAGAAASLRVGATSVLLGGSPDGSDIPDACDRKGHDWVVWVTHHNLHFPDYEAGTRALSEIRGVDMVVNGHIHRPQRPQQRGQTLWCNPGNIVRTTRSDASRARQPACSVWSPERPLELETVIVPHQPFDEVFARPGAPRGEMVDESRFITGLENLSMRRTQDAVGLHEFLEANLDKGDDVDGQVWELYQEVVDDSRQG